MTDYRAVEQRLVGALGLQRRPVAVAFRPSPPAGVPRFSDTEPSGCSFWRLAATERTFYTVPADHHNCPIGSYAHNIALPPDRAGELPQTLGLMTDLGYLERDEVPGFPRLPQDVARVAAEAQTIAAANAKLSEYHRERRRVLATE